MTGIRSFVYIPNMTAYQPTRELHVHGPRVRILFAQFRSVGRWQFDDLRAPYWRLYHLAQPGAWVDAGAGLLPLDPACLYLLPAQTPFSSGADREVDQFFVHFTVDPHPRLSSAAPPALSVVMNPGIQDLLNDARDETRPEAQALLLSALVRAVLARSGLTLSNRGLSTRMEKAQQLLRDHLSDGIRNADLASALHLSENGFVRWFRNEAGVSPQAWLARERVHEAGFWLHHTDAPLDRIADLHGFCDRYHFSRVFKKHQGISPAAFRRNREPGPHPLTVRA
jgi:AraC-like DNA-binding protein